MYLLIPTHLSILENYSLLAKYINGKLKQWDVCIVALNEINNKGSIVRQEHFKYMCF